MPELPEVETVARTLDAKARGRSIVSIWLGSKPEPFRSRPQAIADVLTGSTIERAHRVGKHVVVELVRHAEGEKKCGETKRGSATNSLGWRGQWLIHLGMTGQLLVCGSDTPLPPHTHAIAHLDDGREIRFVDPRRFGRLSIIDLNEPGNDASGGDPMPTRRFAGSGQEPLEISALAFRGLFRNRRAPIKSALLNQKLLHGVGNIYADESLFRAGIRPRRQSGRLTAKDLERLRLALQDVLRSAIAAGGSSVSDYVNADGEPGFFQFEHKVYLRTGEPCLVCDEPIRRIVLGGRGTHFCRKCQR